MRNLQEATERICELKGNLVALDALATTLLRTLSNDQRAGIAPVFERHAEVARAVLIHTPISEHTIAAFEKDVSRMGALIASATDAPDTVEPVLLTTVRIRTFDGQRELTGATGFFFQRDERLFLVTSRHVMIDEPSGHRPDRIEITLHTDERDLTRIAVQSMLLYRDGHADWRQADDSGGPIDVAVLEVDRTALPSPVVLRAFTPAHLATESPWVEVGQSLRVVGFPLGFHDALHHLPVVRQAAVASSFGRRFQGRGLFLTDGRMHRGTSGAPVLVRSEGVAHLPGQLPWILLGVHSSRMDVGDRDRDADESLGLNGAWYADVLTALTQ